MARKQLIQIYRGDKNGLLSLSGDSRIKQGELAFTTDTNEVYVGGASLGVLHCIGGYTSGIKSARPTEDLIDGEIYLATDENIFYTVVGGSWVELGGEISGLDDKMDLQTEAVEHNIGIFDDGGQTVDSGMSFDDDTTTSTNIWSSLKTKNEIDTVAAGLSWQEDVQGIIDNVETQYPGDGNCPALASGQRYIITDIVNTPHENWGTLPEGLGSGDIIEYDGTSWEIAYNVSESGDGAMVYSYGVQDGDVDHGWRQYKGETWSAFYGFDEIVAGDGLEKEGVKTFNVKVSDFAGTGLEDDESNNIRIATTAAGNGLTGGGGDALAVQGYTVADNTIAPVYSHANGTGVTVDNDSLKHTTGTLSIKDLGVKASHLNSDVITNGLTGANGSAVGVLSYTEVSTTRAPVYVDANGVAVTVDNSSLDHNEGQVRVKAQGIAASHLGSIIGNGLTGASGEAIAALSDTTGGTNLAKSVNVSSNGLALKIDDETIKENTENNRLYVYQVDGGSF